MSTREKILDTALTLFNKNGTADVSTNHIAEAAGISPGNLYYHFHNKEEIIRELFERLFAANDQELSLPADTVPTLDDLQELARTNYKILWRYRGLYRELPALLRNDPEIKARFLAVRARGLEDFHGLIDMFVSAGVLSSPGTPEELADLAEVLWMITEFWLSSLEVSGKTVNESQMECGVQLMMQILKPYIMEGNSHG